MIARGSHLTRALAAACAAFLLASAPLAVRADDTTPPAPAPPPVPAATTAPVTISSVIHSGDTLAISVYGEPALSQTAVVQADGTIQYPLVQRVMVAGMSAAEARDSLATALKKFIHRPIVALAVQQTGQINVTVLGNVKNPGKYMIRNGAHLSDVIAAGGGIATTSGHDPIARIQPADGGQMTTANVQRLMRAGDPSQNLPVEEGAYVYVTGAELIRVQVVGAVSRPGNVEVSEGDRLSMALARAGAEAAAKSDLSRVYLTRIDPATGKTSPSYEINVYQALQRGDQRFDPILQKDDKIYVTEARTISPASIGILSLLGRLLGF